MKEPSFGKHFTRLNLAHAIALATACLALSRAPVQAQTSFAWDGGDGSSPLWSTAANWSPDGAPTNFFAADFTFGGTVNLGTFAVPLNNDLTNGTITNLTFSAGAGTFYLAGNVVTNRLNITNNSGVPQVLNLPMVLSTNPAANTPHFIYIGAGGSITSSASITAPVATASLNKFGPGTLVFNSPLTNTIGNGNAGGAGVNYYSSFSVDEGTVIFDGGPTSRYFINGEAVFGKPGVNGNRNVTAILQSGTLANTLWFGIGRGNGVGDVNSIFIANNASSLYATNFTTGYNTGDATRRARAFLTLNNSAVLYALANSGNAFQPSESPGTYFEANVNDSAQILVNGGTASRARFGLSGRAVVKLNSPTAGLTTYQNHFGDAAGGAGALYNRGGFTNASPASVDHFSIGSVSGGATPANNSFGYYLNDTATPVGLSEIGVGGSGGGDGVLEVKQGTVNVTNWITVCRSGGTTANSMQSALLLVRGGTVNAPNVEQFRYIWSASGISEYGLVDVGAGGKIGSVNGPNSAIDLATSANALSFSTLTLGAGGTIEVGRIFAGQAAPLNVVNLNGGTLSPTKTINGFIGANLDGVFVHAGGVTFDTKGFDITIVPTLQAPYDSGIASIPVATPGSGYIGRPIVRISDPTGMGASAIAVWSEASGTITGITITSPGSGYSSPIVTLVGGGFTNAATLGAPVLGPVANGGGGLTKAGAGMLTLSGGYSFTGPIVVSGGTLNLNTTATTPFTAGDLIVSNAVFNADASAGVPVPAKNVTVTNASLALNAYAYGYSLNAAGSVSLQNNAVLNFNYGTVSMNPLAAAIGSSGPLTIPGTNITINIAGFGLQIGQFPLIKYTGASPGSLAELKLGPLPPGVVATLVNNTANSSIDLNITSAGQNLAWYGLLPDGLTTSSNWDITVTTNWIGAGGFFPPALRYQEYTSAGSTVGDPVRFDDQLYNDFVNPQMTNVFLATALRPFLITVDATLPYSFAGSGYLSGIGSLVKSNTGSLTLGSSNDFTGGTRLAGGSIVITNDANLGGPAGLLTMIGGTLQVNGNITNTRPMSLSADSPFRVASGMTAQLGGLFSGTARLLFNDTGTAILTNREAMGFHVRSGTLIFDLNARITNNYSYTSIGLGSAPGDFGKLIIQSNALFEINQDLNIADINDARGRLDIAGSAVLRTMNFWVGKNDTCTGLVYQTGGIVTNHTATLNDWRIAGTDAIRGPTTFGGYYLSGGRLDVKNNFQVGAYGMGELIISGGALNQWGAYPSIGRFTNAVGTLTVSGGQFNHLSTGTYLIIGEQGTGTLNVNGTGVVTLTNALRLGGAGGNGTVNLGTGGRLITSGVQLLDAIAGVGTLNFGGGTLQANASSSAFMAGLSAANILAGGAIIDSSSNNIAIDQPLLSGVGGGLTKLGTGALTLTGSNTYSGPTVVSAGRLLVAPAHQTPGAVTVADGAGFGGYLNGPGTASVGSLTLGTAGATTLEFVLTTGSNPAAPVLRTGTLTVNGTTNTIRLSGQIALGTFPVLKYSGALAGSGSINPVVAGPQGLVASSSNDVAGSTIYVTVTSTGPGLIWAGTNSVAGLTNLWNLNAATNWLSGSTPTYYQEIIPPGDAVLFDDIGTGVVLLSNTVSPARVVFANSNKSYTLSGSGRISGATGLTKQNTGTATFSLSGSDYTGDTTISGGTLKLGNATAIPDGANSGSLIVNPAGTLDLNGFSETLSGLLGSGAISNNGALATLTVGNSGKVADWKGTIDSANGILLTKVGTNTLTISGTNVFRNGNSAVNGGVTLVTNGGVIVNTTGEYWVGNGANTLSTNIVDGGVLIISNWLAIGRNATTATGTLIVNSGTVQKAGANNIVLGSLAGNGTLIVNGGQVLNNGMLWLGENTGAYGYFYLNGGLVQATQVRSNGTPPVASVAYLNGGTLQASGNNADYFVCAALVQSKGFVLDDGGYSIALTSSPLQEDPASPGGGLTKSGTGTVTFNAVNTYTGPTVVSNGTLLVNSTLATASIAVRSGATLGGTGIISAPVTINLGGTLGSGPNIGTLTLNLSPTLNGRVFAKIDRNAGVSLADKIAVGGTLAYGGTLAITNIGAPLQVGDTFDLFDAAGFSGSFTIVSYTPGQSVTWDTSMLATDGTIKVASIMVTTPVSIGMGLSGNTLTLSWPSDHTGWRLQVQTNSLAVGISTNWVTVPGSTTTNQVSIPVDTANGTVFYRLLFP